MPLTTKHVNISSSDITSAGYDPILENLEISFVATGTYRYYSVPSTVANGFIDSPSPGKFFLQQVKGKYTWEKVTEAAHA